MIKYDTVKISSWKLEIVEISSSFFFLVQNR